MKYHIHFNQILDCFYVSEDVMWYINSDLIELSNDDVKSYISQI